MIALLAATVLCATPPTHGNARPVWAPSPFVASDERPVEVRVLAGFQDYVLPAETRFTGLGLVPGLPGPLAVDAQVQLNSKPWLIFDHVQFAGGVLVQYDSFTPVMMSLRFLSRPFGGVRFGLQPLMLTGFDVGLAALNVFAGSRNGRLFWSAGLQGGARWQVPRPVLFGALFGAVGVEAVPGWVSLSLEAGTNIADCHRAMLNATLDLVYVRLSAGGGLASVGGELRPTFQAVVGASFGTL